MKTLVFLLGYASIIRTVIEMGPFTKFLWALLKALESPDQTETTYQENNDPGRHQSI